MPRVRRATHAGSWYDASAEPLREKIDGWLDAAVTSATEDPVRAIIAPHAGHRYCGHIMAHAYKALDPTRIKRVFLLGPSHHVYSPHCLLSGLSTYSTPLGDISIDQEVSKELLATGHFKTMPRAADEAEHSLELHMPFIVHVFRDAQITLVPIMVGAITYESEAKYGAALARYLDDPGNIFVISSDFCHWGQRFQFTFFDEHKGPIHKSVEWLDRKGMDIIETGIPSDFRHYLEKYNNTICGRHPIGVLLQMVHLSEAGGKKYGIKFNAYDQSSRCTSFTDSSVSYASALVTQAGVT